MKLLRSTLPLLRTGLPLLKHAAPDAVVERVRGKANQLMRRRVFVRDGWLCQCPECQAGWPMSVTMETGEADHVVPLYLGGTNDVSNFRTLHVDCHKRITAQQAAERAARHHLWTDGL